MARHAVSSSATPVSQGEVRKRILVLTKARSGKPGASPSSRREARPSSGLRLFLRAEAQDALDALKHPARRHRPRCPRSPSRKRLARYLAAKARKRSLRGDERITKHLLAEFGEQTPLAGDHGQPNQRVQGQATRGPSEATPPAQPPRSTARWRSCATCSASRTKSGSCSPPSRRSAWRRRRRARLRWLKPEEATNLLTKCRESKNPDLADLVEFALYTGSAGARPSGSPGTR